MSATNRHKHCSTVNRFNPAPAQMAREHFKVHKWMRSIGSGKSWLWLVFLIVLVAEPAWAAAIPRLFNTGVNEAGKPLPDNASDPHYRLVAGSVVTGQAIVTTSSNQFPVAPFGPWLGDNATSAWISPSSSSWGPNAPNSEANYWYETSFDLTGLNPGTAVITGFWATDNRGMDILINGFSTGQTNMQQFAEFTYFQIDSGFVDGTNTLTFAVNNGAGESDPSGPTGLRLEMTGTAEPVSPAPLRLSIKRLDLGRLSLSWPVSASAAALREAVTLPSSEGWTPVTNPVVQVGDRMTVTVDASGGNRFYRLQAPLRRRAIFLKPTETVVEPGRVDARQIVLKFHEGTHVRLRSAMLDFDHRSLSYDERMLLRRVDLTLTQIKEDLEQVHQLLQQDPERRVIRMFTQTEEQLGLNKSGGEAMSGEELADLDLYYYVVLPEADAQVAADLINALNRLPSVEIAYPEPTSSPATCSDQSPTTTINVTPAQGYLLAAPLGIDAQYAWTFPGGRGANVAVIDIEKAWHLNHEDLPDRAFFQVGIFDWLYENVEHGTAVLGELVACDNGYGATGIVPDAEYGVSALRVPDAVNNAAAYLSAGDVILIEQHAPGPSSGLMCPGAPNQCSQFEFVAMENWQADFDAIRAATARGIIVVEAAGNGAMNLDASWYGGRFNRTIRDSGAILVGAGLSGGLNGARKPWWWSNFGSRVDVQGWGDLVGTLGYGATNGPNGLVADPTLQANGADPLQWYTRQFNGTSSASPIVAGAAIAIQGVRRAQGLPVLDSLDMRALLVRTGTPQPTPPPGTILTNIGPLPDIRRALNSSIQAAGFVSQSVPSCMNEGRIYFVTVTMRNTGPTIWRKTDLHRLGSQNPQDNLTWGLHRVELASDVPPGGLAVFNFSVTAPSRGRYYFQWRMLQESVAWFGGYTPNLAVEVVPDNDAEYVQQIVPSTMVAGRTYPVSVTLRNIGASTWSPNAGYKLSSENPHGNSTWGISTVALNQSVPPNSVGTFQFNVTAPVQAGTYNFQWRMLQDGIACFNGPSFGVTTPNVSIAVTPTPVNDACFVSQTLPNGRHQNDTSAVTVTMKNCGTATWTSEAGYRLGSQDPPNNNFWGLTRVELPNPVPPGATVTFNFLVTATQSAGTFYRWQMVKDIQLGGQVWFGEPTPPTLILLEP